jgi:hypothetical protein
MTSMKKAIPDDNLSSCGINLAELGTDDGPTDSKGTSVVCNTQIT